MRERDISFHHWIDVHDHSDKSDLGSFPAVVRKAKKVAKVDHSWFMA
jgi:hypothetical protein